MSKKVKVKATVIAEVWMYEHENGDEEIEGFDEIQILEYEKIKSNELEQM